MENWNEILFFLFTARRRFGFGQEQVEEEGWVASSRREELKHVPEGSSHRLSWRHFAAYAHAPDDGGQAPCAACACPHMDRAP